MNTAFVSAGLVLLALAQDERNLSPKEATAADQADFRGIGEAILGGRQWSPFMNWTPPRLDIDTLGGSVSIDVLRHKVPKAAKQAHERGVKFLEKGDFASAAKELERATALDPGYAAAHNDRGVSYTRLGRGAEAEAEFRSAVALDRYLSAAYSNLGWVLFHKRSFVEAERNARGALALSSRNDSARLLLGILLASNSGTLSDGLQHLELAARTVPGLSALIATLRERKSGTSVPR